MVTRCTTVAHAFTLGTHTHRHGPQNARGSAAGLVRGQRLCTHTYGARLGSPARRRVHGNQRQHWPAAAVATR